MTKEGDLIKRILLELTRQGARLFRCNTGSGWTGRAVHRAPGGEYITVYGPRPLQAGLVKGGADIIGWTPVEITPDMVGQTLGVFTAIEVKTGKQRTTDEQARFLQAVLAGGGRAAVARSVDEAVDVIASR